ncbi:WG repeat-containing protein [Spirosoma endbachense]|uniref:WG repeat-containing protein n=1 Tax=Spirosoma endbachense TaxID=2666025 RepID=A0A6P1VWL0_9BACT|nr:WG repeat-containing protein [Spirosoma endbachense]QHV95766.1 WG repeat-containing protein [Spirosoma endbachense]
MTLTELKERIKEEVVLHEGDLKEWQWRRNGLLTEAEQDGIPSAEFMRLVNDVSYQLGGLFPRINALKSTAETYARADKKQLLPLHLDELVAEAERLTLSKNFVTKRWLPAILATIPDPPKSETVAVPVQPPAPVTPPSVVPVVPTSLSRDEVRRKVAAKLDDYKSQRTIPAWVLRDLLYAINGDESIVTEEIFSYLVSNFFKAAREPQGNTLRERLVSADWENVLFKVNPEPAPVVTPEPYRQEPSRIPEPQPIVRSFTAQPARVRKGEAVTLAWEVENLLAVTIDDLGAGLSPQNRGWVKPTKTTDYTLFDVNNNPLSTVRVEVIRPDRSGVYGVLFALALLALIYWFIKNTNSEKTEPVEKPRTEKTSERSGKTPVHLAGKKRKKSARTTKPESEKPTETIAKAEPAPKAKPEKQETPVQTTSKPIRSEPSETRSSSQAAKPQYSEPSDKPYDKVDNRTDEQGWRMARKGKRWGYVNEFDEWVIEPQFEATTPFRGNVASVFFNGQLMKINRAGEQVKN